MITKRRTIMPNLAAALKLEISRIARKEVRRETAGLKKAIAAYRAEIAALKRRSGEMERQLRRPEKEAKASPVAALAGPSGKGRYSAKSLASQRRRLGLSANELGQLIGVSAQSIYNWEEGKARPRGAHLPAIAFLRTVGKKQAMARLESLKNAA
jgi:DNA-binding transcriptional regulator YiaG